MAMHPDKQRKAQAEIDGVTEGLRLPTMADREHMPYVEAIMKEVAKMAFGRSVGRSSSNTVTLKDVHEIHY